MRLPATTTPETRGNGLSLRAHDNDHLTLLHERILIMTSKDKSKQMEVAHPHVRLTAICRRVLSTAEVLHDATDSRLSVGEPEKVMKLSESDAGVIIGICDKLLRNLLVAKKQTGGKSDALDAYETPHERSEQGTEECPGSDLGDRTYHRLLLVRDAAHDVADHIRSIWHIPPNWVVEQGLDRDEERLEFVLVSLEQARRDILKELAKLVMIFDLYDDSGSAQPWEAWLIPYAASGAERG